MAQVLLLYLIEGVFAIKNGAVVWRRCLYLRACSALAETEPGLSRGSDFLLFILQAPYHPFKLRGVCYFVFLRFRQKFINFILSQNPSSARLFSGLSPSCVHGYIIVSFLLLLSDLLFFCFSEWQASSGFDILLWCRRRWMLYAFFSSCCLCCIQSAVQGFVFICLKIFSSSLWRFWPVAYSEWLLWIPTYFWVSQNSFCYCFFFLNFYFLASFHCSWKKQDAISIFLICSIFICLLGLFCLHSFSRPSFPCYFFLPQYFIHWNWSLPLLLYCCLSLLSMVCLGCVMLGGYMFYICFIFLVSWPFNIAWHKEVMRYTEIIIGK